MPSRLARAALLFCLCGPASALAQQGVVIVPPSVSFPPQAIGTSSVPVTLTVTNPDPVPHTIFTYIAFGCVGFTCPIPPGWYTDFSFVTDCTQSPLLPGASCTVDITFTPTGPGPRNSSLTVYPQFVFTVPPVPLSGTGTDPRAIPTLGPGQLLLLAGLLMGAAIRIGRRTRAR